jgi:hypothetical protein
VLGVVVVVGIVALRSATMNRPDAPRLERSTSVELTVRTNGSRLPAEAAAYGLWAACSSAVDAHQLIALDQVGESSFTIRLEPALGEHAQRRLVGCLEDTTVPRILGSVGKVEHL